MFRFFVNQNKNEVWSKYLVDRLMIRQNRRGTGVLGLFLCLSLFTAVGKAQSGVASMLIGQWSAHIIQNTVSGYVLPQRDFNVLLTFRADGTYLYTVNQADSPVWQLTVNGSYTAVTAPPNPDYNLINVTLIPSSVLFNGNGLSDAQKQTELSRLSYENFPTTVQQTFGASWDSLGTLYLKNGFTSSTYRRTSLSVPSLNNITLSTVPPAAAGCTVPPASTSFTISDGTVYLYFEATVTAADKLSASWLAPDGTTENTVTWNASTGSLCFTGAQLNVANDQGHLGTWRVIISDNGSQIASIPFTLSQSIGLVVPSLHWQNDLTRDVTMWFMGGAQGSTYLSQNYIGATPGWSLRATADMNRDGVPDLLWQNDTTRQVTVWFMGGTQGSTYVSQSYIGATLGWTLRGSADMNRDGVPDLLWQNDTTRQVTVWFMGGAQGSTYLSQNYIGAAPGWSLRGAADLNRDGVPDLLWQNDTTRQVTVWFMGGTQGSTYLSQNYIGAAPGWSLRGAADLNRDGVPDLLWQNDTTRQVTVWFMGGTQGSTYVSQSYIGAAPGWSLEGSAH